jgi:hypothetical protein
VNPTVAAARATFGDAIGRATLARDATAVVVAKERLVDILRWLKDTPAQGYDYLVDITAVEYRDKERPLEVVYQLRSLAHKANLRVKVELDPHGELAVDSVTRCEPGGGSADAATCSAWSSPGTPTCASGETCEGTPAARVPAAKPLAPSRCGRR